MSNFWIGFLSAGGIIFVCVIAWILAPLENHRYSRCECCGKRKHPPL